MSSEMLRDVSTTTVSMRRARRWLAEMRAEAAQVGQTLEATTIDLYEHAATCRNCELREESDSYYCELADRIMDAPYEDDDR